MYRVGAPDSMALPRIQVAASGGFRRHTLPGGRDLTHAWNPRLLPAGQTVSVPVTWRLQVTTPRMTSSLSMAAAP